MSYMGGLMQSGKLKSAQPLEMEGVLVSGTPGKLKDGPFNETKEVIAGYFLIQAADLDEAIQIARQNPVFEDGTNARIEVRPIKVMEGYNGRHCAALIGAGDDGVVKSARLVLVLAQVLKLIGAGPGVKTIG
jgi:hypothetical protein